MRVQVFKGSSSLRLSACELSNTRLSITLVVETPETDLKAGDEISLQLSSGEILRFKVREERHKRRYYCEIFFMPSLEKITSIGASVNQPISQIAQSELGAILSDSLKGDYILNNFAFKGSLWSLLSQIEELIEGKAYAGKEGVVFQPIPSALSVGKKINTSFNTQEKSQYELSSFKLLPCFIEGREVRKLHYNFMKEIIWVWT